MDLQRNIIIGEILEESGRFPKLTKFFISLPHCSSWNVRGLNSPAKHRMLKNMIQQDKPSLVYLQETKCNSIVLEKILNKA